MLLFIDSFSIKFCFAFLRFVCCVCGKKVARSGDLAIHMRSHTGERPYACTLCPKRYRMSCHLTAHMKSHTGKKIIIVVNFKVSPVKF